MDFSPCAVFMAIVLGATVSNVVATPQPGIADIMNDMTGLVDDVAYDQGKCSNIVPWAMAVDYFLIKDEKVEKVLTLECAETKMGMWVEPHRNASLLIQQLCVEVFPNNMIGNVYNWTQVMFHTQETSGEFFSRQINISIGSPDYSKPIMKGIPARLGDSIRYNYIATGNDAKARGLESIHGNYAVYRDEKGQILSAHFNMDVYMPTTEGLLLRSNTEKTFVGQTTEYMITTSLSPLARGVLSQLDWKNHLVEKLTCDRMKSVNAL